MRRAYAIATALPLMLSAGATKAADPTVLAETGGFLLGNAQRCGVGNERVERAEKVIRDFIVAAAKDSREVAAADSRFAEIFLASALPDRDRDAFPSCAIVIQQFERLEQHHQQAAGGRGARTASPNF